MRILIRTSKWAIWARRLGSFALPLAIVPVLMHRNGAIDTSSFEIVEALAIVVALLALICSITAFARIWTTGDEGWWRALAGLAFSLVCLAPPAVLLADYVRYPLVAEVSTNPADPPQLLSGTADQALPTAIQSVDVNFPNLKTRNYPLPPEQIFGIVDKLVAERGWDIRERHVPTDLPSDGQLDAIAISLFGFRDEVSIRVRSDAVQGSSVDMRSAALTPLHEAGDNAFRIEDFLTALDAQVTALMKAQPAGASDDDTDADTPADPVPVIPAPAPRARKR